MRSVEVALAADYARRGIWIIPVILLAITALPLWLFVAFRFDGVLAPESRESVVLHGTLTLLIGFGASIAVFQSQGKLARHFIRPISVSRLVACQMALGIVTIVGMYAIAAAVLNLGGAGWPVIGPALFLATVLACSLAAIWSLEGSILLQLLGCIATSTPLVIWFSRCYGAAFMGWDRMWLNPTAGEALTLVSIMLAAFGVAIVGVSRVRRGDVIDLSALIQWLDRQLAGRFAARSFATPRAAQDWCEFRQKMTLAPPLLLAGFLLFILALWVFNWFMDTAEMLEITRTMPLVFTVVIIPLVFGLVAGNCGHEGGKHGMRFVLATRPMTDTFLAFAILRNCCTVLLLSWATWIVGYGLILATVAWAGHQHEVMRIIWPEGTTFQQLATVSFVLVLLSWTFTSLMATLLATGRTAIMVGFLGVLFSIFLAFALLKTYLPEYQYQALMFGWLAGSGGIYLLVTIIAFVVAVRMRMVGGSIVLPCVGAWLLLTIAILSIDWPALHRDGAFLLHCIGAMSLSILPFAAMPLAVRWNRHR